MEKLIISNHPATGQIAGIASCMAKITMYQFHSVSPVRKILKSTRNAFGLFRQYHATHFPERDPDENLTLEDLMDTNTGTSPEPPIYPYHPYPNRSSFLLGEWYRNNGTKKSQSGFKNLIEVVGDPAFGQKMSRRQIGCVLTHS
jgi:hypothetical protein